MSEAYLKREEGAVFGKLTENRNGMQQVVDILKAMPELIDIAVFGVDIVTVTPEAARRIRDFEMYFWAEYFGNCQISQLCTKLIERRPSNDCAQLKVGITALNLR